MLATKRQESFPARRPVSVIQNFALHAILARLCRGELQGSTRQDLACAVKSCARLISVLAGSKEDSYRIAEADLHTAAASFFKTRGDQPGHFFQVRFCTSRWSKPCSALRPLEHPVAPAALMLRDALPKRISWQHLGEETVWWHRFP